MTAAAVRETWAAVAHRVGRGRPVLVAVDGRSGSGKTTYAAHLRAHAAERLGVPTDRVGLVAVEELYPGWEGLTAAPALLDWHVLRPLREGATAVTWPRWDWAVERYSALGRMDLPPTGVVVVEGVGCSAPPARGAYDHVVWLQAPADLRRTAVARREDATSTAPGTPPWWHGWARAEDRLLAAHPPHHDQLVERSGVDEERSRA